jgi:hypothetical protein
MKNRAWVLLVLLAVAIRWAAFYPEWIERNYSTVFFPVLAAAQRFLLGWIPFSVGDLFYGLLFLLIVFKTSALVLDLFRKRVDRNYLVQGAQQIVFSFLFIYVFFNLFWGLNYSRAGIGYQLQLSSTSYSVDDVDRLTTAFLAKATANRSLLPQQDEWSSIRKRTLFAQAIQPYRGGDQPFSLFENTHTSIKPSLYSYLGNYLGFQGYYNPFSGEAQVNTTIPPMLQPFVALHELAHQAGYAKESEANFVGYLAGKDHPDPLFRYSVYLELFRYAHAELYRLDTARAIAVYKSLPAPIKNDLRIIRDFYMAYQTPVERIIMTGYDYFLQANDQPKGMRSYHEVVGWVLALIRKKGIEAL